MFKKDDIIDFINKIINLDETLDNKKEIIEKFLEYLVLTKMANKQTKEFINKVLICLPEIITLKEKLGLVDICDIITKTEIKKQKKIETKKEKNIEDKHYNHYSSSCNSSNSSSVSCGGSSVHSSSCFSEDNSSFSCGGGYQKTYSHSCDSSDSYCSSCVGSSSYSTSRC